MNYLGLWAKSPVLLLISCQRDKVQCFLNSIADPKTIAKTRLIFFASISPHVRFFPKRSCVTFPWPANPNEVKKLQELPENSLVPEFLEKAEEIRSLVLNKGSDKVLKGEQLDGNCK